MAAQKNKKILLVDDEPNILVALEFLVKQQGYTVFKATDGMQALEQLEEVHPQLIVLDVMMPGMDGFEVAKRIRSSAHYDNVPIIFLTAKGTKADRMNGYASGGEIYITKPFDNEDLINTINEVVEFG